ncbi:hypothetical protein H2200_004114 [Cladophialophora chaetospira]|uniref:Uncharacterized protein n=1 Tax=Cladophialophora chaetospira TaxID=386627 RepID=A0AA39CLD8_9EURO|nr:hypothetical protein H2200_004114 [Cladophialophora chaetospira]
MAQRPKLVLTFVVSGPEGHENVRQKHLDQAEARSHVAKFSHRRRVSREGRAKAFTQGALGPYDFSQPGSFYSRQRQRAPEPERNFSGSPVDPFDTLGFRITPEMHRIIKVAIHSFLPSLYGYSYIKRLSTKIPSSVRPDNSVAELVQRNIKQGFAHKSCTSAWICTHTISLLYFHGSQQRRDMQRTSLYLKGHAISTLRQRISKLADLRQIDTSLVLQLVWVHGIACMERRFDDAKAHAQLLSRVLNVLLDGPLMVEIFLTAMYNDIELAVSQMKRTTLDFEQCFGKKLAAFWQQYASHIPKLREIDNCSSSCIVSPNLRAIVARLRHFLRMSDSDETIKTSEHPSTGQIMYAWISSVTQYDSGILLNRYLDLMDHQIDSMTLGERYTEAAVTLTLLHLLRKYFHETPLHGIDIRDASRPIMFALQLTISLAIENSSEAERSANEDAYLWMFFAGAQHEVHFESMYTAAVMPPCHWYRKMLAKQARRLNVMEWLDSRRVLQHFLYTDHLEPHASKWFESTVISCSE